MPSLFPTPKVAKVEAPAITPATKPALSSELFKGEFGPCLTMRPTSDTGNQWNVVATWFKNGEVTRVDILNDKDEHGHPKPMAKMAAWDLYRRHSVMHFLFEGKKGLPESADPKPNKS